ncbi:CGNR zinc finger domain-containing protein, partial [Streptomyces albidoflavus]
MLATPALAALVEAFANTLDVDEVTDALATPEELATWLREYEELDAPDAISPEAHRDYLALRAGLREEMGARVGDVPDPALLAAADEALAAHPVAVSVTGALRPAPGTPADRLPLTRLAIAWSSLVATGDAARLKRCAEHTCAWVFWDV